MANLLGNVEIHEDALKQMRERIREGTRWAAYQNHDLGSRDIGHLKFLLCGKDCGLTMEEAHGRMPDTKDAINWRYQFVGWVDLDEGKVVLS